jgi:hypothetical protein
VKYHLVWESADNDLIDVNFIRSEEQLGDILTKPLGRVKVHELHTKIGLITTTEQGFPNALSPPVENEPAMMPHHRQFQS